MIRLSNVSKYYYKKGMISSGISRVNLEFQLGEFVVITGESGSGKSTLLNVISGLDSYEEGEMYINGQETSHYVASDFEKYRKKYIANIFQNFNLVNSYTVYQNIELILLINGYKSKDVRKRINDIIDRVGLSAYRNTKVSKLSGGQKQRVAIARALAKDTDIIVADEPTANLDSESADAIGQLLSEIARDKLVIVVTHSYEQFAPYATRRVKMHDGTIAENTLLWQMPLIQSTAPEKTKTMTLPNQLRIGTRNTFNIFYKFLLLLFIFLFMAASTLGVYAAYFKMDSEANSLNEHNNYFPNASADRIVLTKKGYGEFDRKDSESISKVDGVRSIAENDILLDTPMTMFVDYEEIVLYPHTMSELKDDTVDAGNLPQERNEIFVVVSDHDYDNYMQVDESMLGTKGDLTVGGTTIIKDAVITGIKKDNKLSHAEVYLDDSYLNNIRAGIYSSGSGIRMLINDVYYDPSGYSEDMDIYGMEATESFITTSDRVEKGKMIVPEGFETNFGINPPEASDTEEEYIDKGAIGLKARVTIKNRFYTEDTEFTISNVYNDTNFKKIVGGTNQDEYSEKVYINKDDFTNLFSKGNYQWSVYVKDPEKVDEVCASLERMGYSTFPLGRTMVTYDEEMGETMSDFTDVLTPILIVVLAIVFGICYIVTSLILRSRNSYFSILRMLGLAKRSIRNLLDIEVLIVANIAFVLIIVLARYIPVERAREMVDTMPGQGYVVIYILLILMALIISHMFARKVFKNTAIGSFQEEN